MKKGDPAQLYGDYFINNYKDPSWLKWEVFLYSAEIYMEPEK